MAEQLAELPDLHTEDGRVDTKPLQPEALRSTTRTTETQRSEPKGSNFEDLKNLSVPLCVSVVKASRFHCSSIQIPARISTTPENDVCPGDDLPAS